MPHAPSSLRILPIVLEDDLSSIQQHNPDHAARILRKIDDWEDKIQWGRIPQEHLTYLTGTDEYNFYRERVGNSGYSPDEIVDLYPALTLQDVNAALAYFHGNSEEFGFSAKTESRKAT